MNKSKIIAIGIVAIAVLTTVGVFAVGKYNTPRSTTISEPTLSLTKAYDGTASAAVTPGTLTGIVGNENVTVTATAVYNSPDVGKDKTITVIYVLGGTNATNYEAPLSYSVSNGEITSVPTATTSSVTNTTTSTTSTVTTPPATTAPVTTTTPAVTTPPVTTKPDTTTSATAAK